MAATANVTKPRTVDFVNNFWDVMVKRLKEKHFTHDTIARNTGLTVSQVNYRVKKGSLSIPLEWRRGDNPSAKQVIRDIDAQLRRLMGK